MRRVRHNPSGYVDCAGFDAVMDFVAKTSGDDATVLWLKLAQAAAADHGFTPPRTAKKTGCVWLLKKLQATSPEAQWDLVRRVEPLFHSAWEASVAATDMLECASLLYPPRQGDPRIVSDEVRLATCDVVEAALRYTDDPRVAAAVDTARRFALGQASLTELDAAWAAARASVSAAASNAAWVAASDAASDAAWDAARAAAWAATSYAVSDAASYAVSADTSYAVSDAASYAVRAAARDAANARNAAIVRKSLGTPGLMLLMR